MTIDDGGIKRPTFDVSYLQIGQQFDGVALNVKDYGLFIDIGGYTGLLHRSKLSSGIDFKGTFKKGTGMKVLVNKVQENGKISLVSTIV